MSGTRAAIPEVSGRARRLLALVFGLLAFLATLCLALSGAAHRLLSDAQAYSSAVAIVSLPAPMEGEDGEGDLAGIIAVLRADPQVEQVDPIPETEVREILVGGDDPDMPLPILMEARFVQGVVPDFERIRFRVRAVAATAVVENAGRIGAPAAPAAAQFVRWAGLLLGLAVLALAVPLAVTLTAGRIRRHHDIIDLLRTLGASDRFIAHEFRPHPLNPILIGALIGATAAAVMIVAVLQGGVASSWTGIGGQSFPALDLVLLAGIALLVVAALAGGARLAASRTLHRLH
jgi:cell division transport system permease protein